MHTQTATRTWHHANDNEPEIPFEPPSTMPVAAQTIPIARTGIDVALNKEAAPAQTYGFTETGGCPDAPKITFDLSTWLFASGVDPLIRSPANDL